MVSIWWVLAAFFLGTYIGLILAALMRANGKE